MRDGHLIIAHDEQSTRALPLTQQGLRFEPQALQVADYWGALSNGSLVVSLQGEQAHKLAEQQDHHCSDHDTGSAAWLVRADGSLDTLLCDNVLRAYPGPGGAGVALISPERDLSIWKEGEQTTVTAPGKVSNVGWSPDGRYLVASVYPPDWSQGAVSSARTTEDFLRLQNADLYLFDTEKMKFVAQLSSDAGTEYGAFFSPDGASIYYNWLHATEDEAGLMRLDLDEDDPTTATAAAVKLTRAGNDAGEIPLGRVGTHLWDTGAKQLVFESGLPDGSGEIWVMQADGMQPRKLGAGRKPQRGGNGSVIYMATDGGIKTLGEADLH